MLDMPWEKLDHHDFLMILIGRVKGEQVQNKISFKKDSSEKQSQLEADLGIDPKLKFLESAGNIIFVREKKKELDFNLSQVFSMSENNK